MGSYSLRPEVVYPHCAGIDLGSREHWACGGDADEDVRAFATTTDGVRAMAAWLTTQRITHVVMESTGVYWLPVFDIMEAAGFHVALVNAAHVRNVPGRKTDIKDCQWIRKVYALGFLNDSFVPQDAIRTLRTLVRQRDNHIADQGRHVQLMQKALDQMNIKVHTVISDLDGASGMRVVRAILAGTRDPQELLQLMDPRIRTKKAAEVLASLEGIWKPVYLFTFKQAVAGYDFFATQITECDRLIEQAIVELKKTDRPLDGPRKDMQNHPMPFDVQERLMQMTGGVDLCQITGLAPQNVLQILSETGAAMSTFPTPKQFTAWLSLAPSKRSSGQRKQMRRKWHPGTRAGQALRLAARNLGRTHTALGAFYRRLAARCGKKVANMATARKLALLIYHALSSRQPIRNISDKEYELNYLTYRRKTLDRQAQKIGLKLVPVSV